MLGPSQVPEMPLRPYVPNNKHLTAVTTFFFERGEGEFIAVSANEAWNIYSGKNQVIGRQPMPWRYVGRTDGKVYLEYVKKSHQILPVEGLKAAQDILEEGLKAEYELSKKDTRPPPNFDVMDGNGMPIHNLSTYGN